MTRLTREELKSKVRPDRVPVYEANRNKITVEGLDHENFQYRWVNDKEDRLDVFLKAQWEFVPKKGLKAGDGGIDLSSRTTSAMSKGMGGGVVAYLMCIPKDIWLMDQARKEKEDIAALEAEMRRHAQSASDYGRLTINSKKDQI
jgi:hypothetical protein